MPRMDSPMRRVLGNKTTNASVRPSSPAKTWKHPTTSSDKLSVSFGESKRSPRSPQLFKSPRIGQKRRIDEVEHHDRHDSQQSTDTQRLSQATDLLSDDSSEMEDLLVDSTENTKSTAHTSLTSFQASQNEPEPVEVEFQIPDEMSQRTLDKMVRWSFWVSRPLLMLLTARDRSSSEHVPAIGSLSPQPTQRNFTNISQPVQSHRLRPRQIVSTL